MPDVPGFEVRTVGLRMAAGRLRIQVADLGAVVTAWALVDVEHCPICRTQAHRAR